MPAHIIWMMGLLEAVTVPLVVALPAWTGTALKNPLHGLVVGFAGVVIVFYCISLALDKLNIFVLGKTVVGIRILASAFWGGLILALIFVLQQALKSMPVVGYPFREMILGFLSVGGAVFICGAVYARCALLIPLLEIQLRTSDGLLAIRKFSLWRFALWAGCYEGIALPIIWASNFYPGHKLVAAILTGFAGGLAGATVIWLMAKIFRILPFMLVEQVLQDGQITVPKTSS